jgi:hypothetical protein
MSEEEEGGEPIPRPSWWSLAINAFRQTSDVSDFDLSAFSEQFG